MSYRTTSTTQSGHVTTRVARTNSRFSRNYSGLLASLGFAASLLVGAPALAQVLGAAQSFAILGGTAVTAAPPMSTINGDVGIAPAAASFITGFPANATVVPPFINQGNNGASIAARAATLTLFNSSELAPAGGVAITANLSIGGPSANGHYVPGKYSLAVGTAIIPTSITLDGAGIYVFSLNSDITTSVGSTVILNGVDPCTVFWRVPTLATLNGTTFPGTVVAGTGVHLGTGASLTGRALAAAAGDVTMAGGNNVGGCSAAPVLGSITINKTAVGGDATFGYTASPALGTASFNITTSGGTGSHVTTGLLAGAYTVTESTVPAGYVRTGLACTDSTAGSTFTYSGAQANINFVAGGTVTCTYTNARLGSITINKTAVGGDATFGYTASTALGTSFDITTASGTGNHQTTTGLMTNTYTVTESTVPTGWALTGLACTSYNPNAVSTFTISGATATIHFATEGIVTCTYTNTLSSAATHLIIHKTVVNNSGGVLTPAAFSGTIGGAVVATGGNTWTGASTDRTLTTVGAYSVAETAQAGYTATFSADCSGTIAVGETKICTVTNTFNVAVPVASIPTLSEWAMIVLAALMAITGFVAMRRKES